MRSINLSWRYCCTCEYWQGNRAASVPDRVEYMRGAEGICTEGSWDWGGQPRTALSTCTGWRQLAILENVAVS